MSVVQAYERLRGAVEAIVYDNELDLCGHRQTLARVLQDTAAMTTPDRERTHRNDPDTSRAAAASRAMSGGDLLRCFDAIERLDVIGATFDELIVSLGMHSAQRRVSELKRAGWIEPIGKRPTRRGRMAEVYIATATGVRARRQAAGVA